MKEMETKRLVWVVVLMLTTLNGLYAADGNPTWMRLILKTDSKEYALSTQPVIQTTDLEHLTVTAGETSENFAVSNADKVTFYSKETTESSVQYYVNLTLSNSEVYSFAVSSTMELTWGRDEESNVQPLSFEPGEGCREVRTFLNVRLPEGKTYSFEVTSGMTVTLTTSNLESAQTSSLHLKKNNIDAIVAAMSTADKANLLVGGGYRATISSYIDFWGQRVEGAVGDTDAFDDYGIPQIVLTDGPAGVRISSYSTTSFPCGISLASMRDTTMVERVGAALGNETLEFGCDILLGPGMNIMRNPLCGRNFEYFSEDPWLAGKTAAAYIRGVQSQGVGCAAKHFACNNQETGRKGNNSVVEENVLRQLYFRPFEMAVHESKPWTFMTSYNKLNGTYTSENKWLITDVLRGEWGFNGLVMTDWDDAHTTINQVKAGNDLMMPGLYSQETDITKGIKNKTLTTAELDACVHRMLELIVKTPTFIGYKYSNKPDMEAHAQLSRQAAIKGTVLLKNNDKTLPLNVNETGTVALFGANSYDLLSGGIGSGSVNTPYVIDIYQGLENAGFTLDPTLRSSYLSYVNSSFNRNIISVSSTIAGLGQNPLYEKSVSESDIESAAAGSSVAVITIARQSAESVDRSNKAGDFTLDDNEMNLIKNVCSIFHAQNKKVIVILNICGVIETASWKELPDAILCPWLPGLEGGNAIADIISGNASPGGRLPMTFPNSYDDVPAQNFGNDSENVYSEGLNTGRTYYDAHPEKVSYPFGWGLSYEEQATGDVNNDGITNVSDMTQIVDILTGVNRNFDLMSVDLDRDGIVTIADLCRLTEQLRNNK